MSTYFGENYVVPNKRRTFYYELTDVHREKPYIFKGWLIDYKTKGLMVSFYSYLDSKNSDEELHSYVLSENDFKQQFIEVIEDGSTRG